MSEGDSHEHGSLQAPAAREAGEKIGTLGSDGHGFTLHVHRPRLLLIADGVGIPPTLSLADELRGRIDAKWNPLVLMGSDDPFPFRPRPSKIYVGGMPDGSIACMPLLDEWGVASRLASLAGLPGCFEGSVTQLAEEWLRGLDPDVLAEVEIFACGGAVMLEAAAEVARRYGVPWQVLPIC